MLLNRQASCILAIRLWCNAVKSTHLFNLVLRPFSSHTRRVKRVETTNWQLPKKKFERDCRALSRLTRCRRSAGCCPCTSSRSLCFALLILAAWRIGTVTYVLHGSLRHLTPYQTETIVSFGCVRLSRSHFLFGRLSCLMSSSFVLPIDTRRFFSAVRCSWHRRLFIELMIGSTRKK